MKVQFQKYQGAGNDFIMIDNHSLTLSKSNKKLISWLCDRKFGIGADGVIFIQPSDKVDFEMVYFNADGKIGSMCGNGARCTVIFAKKLDIFSGNITKFAAFDGVHEGVLLDNGNVKVTMADVKKVKEADGHYILNTGSPHYVAFTKKLDKVKVRKQGKAIRYSKPYAKEGINVNFVELNNKNIFMRTYERGVEDETLACGTGTVAVAIAVALKKKNKEVNQSYPIYALGGDLIVSFSRNNNAFTNVWLEGPAEYVFDGELEIPG